MDILNHYTQILSVTSSYSIIKPKKFWAPHELKKSECLSGTKLLGALSLLHLYDYDLSLNMISVLSLHLAQHSLLKALSLTEPQIIGLFSDTLAISQTRGRGWRAGMTSVMTAWRSSRPGSGGQEGGDCPCPPH